MSGPPLSRAGAKPGSLGLTGSAGLQLKPPGAAGGKKTFGLTLSKPKRPAAAPSAFANALEDDLDDDASERARVSKELVQRGGGGSAVSRAAAAAAFAFLYSMSFIACKANAETFCCGGCDAAFATFSRSVGRRISFHGRSGCSRSSSAG